MGLQLVSFVCYGLALVCMGIWAYSFSASTRSSLVLSLLKTAPMVLLCINASTRLLNGFDGAVALLALAFLFHGAGDFLLAETCSLCFTAVSLCFWNNIDAARLFSSLLYRSVEESATSVNPSDKGVLICVPRYARVWLALLSGTSSI